MILENMTVRRVCLHEVYKRREDKTIAPPTYGAGLLELDARGMAAFRSRVLAAFKADAQCMEMTIARHEDGSVAANGHEMVGQDTAGFVQTSRLIADRLAEAQVSRQIPGGLVVVFDGTVGDPAVRFFGVMKAELHEGFLRGANLQATFVDSLFLTPKTKLYKIGMFVANEAGVPAMPDGWSATVYDSQLTSSQRDGAATYFHSVFLGLDIPENNAHRVKQFWEKTRDFINSAPVDQERRFDLFNSLTSYLKTDRSPTIQVGQFAEQYLGDDLGEDYREHMRRERFPTRAITKDLTEVAGSLRTRKFRFPNSVQLTGPAEAIRDMVSVQEVEGEGGQTWTQITVRGKIQSQT